MILSNGELHKALDEGRLVITPEPSPRVPSLKNKHCPYDTHSVDLRLGSELSILQKGPFAYDHTQTAKLSDYLARNSQKIHLTEHTTYSLQPHQFALGITLEHVKLPFQEGCEVCLAARIEGKSSRARTGLLIHFTAPDSPPRI